MAKNLEDSKPKDGIRFEFDNVFRFNPQNYGGLLLYQIGELCCEPGYEILSHKQWCNEISYVVSGSGTFYCNGGLYSVKSGDIFISPLGVTHEIRASSTEQLRFAYLGFDFEEENKQDIYLLLNEFFLQSKNFLAHDVQDIMVPFYRLIDEFYNQSQHGDIMIQSYLLQILIMTHRVFTQNNSSKYCAGLKNKSVGPTVYSIITYLEKNTFECKGVSDLAKVLGYSECYLSHAFKEKMGQTLQSYFIEKKLMKSIEIFKLGNCSISEMAVKLSYSSVQSYSRAFKKFTGLYPSDYIDRYCSLKSK